MGKSKYQFARFKVIDRELRRRSKVKTKHLKEVMERQLEIKVSYRSIQNDIQLMQNDSLLGYFAPIEYDKREKAWYYEDSNYTIDAFGLKEDEIQALSVYANTINAYKDYGIFNRFSAAIDKILNAVEIQKSVKDHQVVNSLIQIDQKPPYTGSDLIPELVIALEERRTIRFLYRKFDDDSPSERMVLPYLLKEYNSRWYLLGKPVEDQSELRTFALDRISKLEMMDSQFDRENIDFNQYFKHTLGITNSTELKPIEVQLAFTPMQGKYVKSVPLHPSQKIITDSDEELTISIQVKPTYELFERILAFGPSVRAISPEFVVKKVKDLLLETIQQY